MVRWLRWHCPPDTAFEIRALAVWGRARYLSVTEAPHNTDFHTWMGKKHFFVSFKPPRPGTEPRTLAWKATVLTTTLGPPPSTCGSSLGTRTALSTQGRRPVWRRFYLTTHLKTHAVAKIYKRHLCYNQSLNSDVNKLNTKKYPCSSQCKYIDDV